jgi:predicted CoA-binding protein
MVNYKTLVLGASTHPERYSHQAVIKLVQSGVDTVPMGVKEGKILELPILPLFSELKDIHTVSIYLSSKHQSAYYNYLVKLNPKRVLFNPGTENAEFGILLSSHGIYWENACTLVLLSTNQYQS